MYSIQSKGTSELNGKSFRVYFLLSSLLLLNCRVVGVSVCIFLPFLRKPQVQINLVYLPKLEINKCTHIDTNSTTSIATGSQADNLDQPSGNLEMAWDDDNKSSIVLGFAQRPRAGE